MQLISKVRWYCLVQTFIHKDSEIDLDLPRGFPPVELTQEQSDLIKYRCVERQLDS